MTTVSGDADHASRLITRMAHSDADQSVARMALYDELRAVLGGYYAAWLGELDVSETANEAWPYTTTTASVPARAPGIQHVQV